MNQKLEGRDLVKRYGRKKVVDSVQIEVNQGEIVGLLGPNGAGKTTTFYMLTGLIPPTRGRVFMNGKDITRMPVHRRARKGIGYLAQEPSAFRKLTVEENVLLVLEVLGKKKKERQEISQQILSEMGLMELKQQKGYSLSGGERRRVEIARALATNPSFLLLDEPFTGVDPIAIQDLQQIIRRLKESRGVGLLVTDHNVRDTLAICDRVYIMYKGRILLSGTSRQVAEDPVAKEYFLGQHFRVPEEPPEEPQEPPEKPEHPPEEPQQPPEEPQEPPEEPQEPPEEPPPPSPSEPTG